MDYFQDHNIDESTATPAQAADEDVLATAARFQGFYDAMVSRGNANDDTQLELIESLISQLVSVGSQREPPKRTSEHFLQNKLTTIEQQASSKSSMTCSICLNDFTNFTYAKKTPCGHVYHASCIIPWLLVKNTCPVCRNEFPIAGQSPAVKTDEHGRTIRDSRGNPFHPDDDEDEEDFVSSMYG